MPNFALGEGIRSKLRDRIISLSARATTWAYADFPLTVEQVQRMILTADQFALCEQLEAKGFTRLIKDSSVGLGFYPEDLPGLRRACTVGITLPRSIITPYYSSGLVGYRNASMPRDARDYIVPDLSVLTQAERHDLTTWLESAVTARRLEEITDHCAQKIFDRYAPVCKTTGHLLALWPLAATLVEDKYWRERFRAPPARMTRYQPTPEVRTQFQMLLKAADMVLTKALMLNDDYEHPAGAVRAHIQYWRQRDGDKRYTYS